MTNGEKYKTAQERAEAFSEFCTKLYNEPCTNEKCIFKKKHFCDDCPFHWLDLEAEEEKPDKCFYCGHSTEVVPTNNGRTFAVKCTNELCGYQSGSDNRHDTIAAHNRVAKAVRESEGK